MKIRAMLTIVLSVLGFALLAPTSSAVAAPAYPPAPTCASITISTTNPNADESVTVKGTGFTANAKVKLVLIRVATKVTTDYRTETATAKGTFTFTTVLPSFMINKGAFILKATSGYTKSTQCPTDPQVEITVASTDDNRNTDNNGGTASTGVDIALLLGLAVLLIGGGVLLNRRSTSRKLYTSEH